MATYKLPNGNTIVADQDFIDAHYPGATLVDEPVVNNDTWHIAVGSFFDRFGQYALPILSSADPSVQALIKFITPRKYIDLQRVDLPGALDLLIAAGFPIDKDAILNTPCQPGEEP